MENELNIQAIEPNAPLPPGWYPAEIRDAEFAVSQAGNDMVVVTFSTEPQKKRVRSWYNTGHPDTEVKARAERDLGHLAFAIGLKVLNNPSELIGHRCEIELEPDGSFDRVKGSRVLQTSTAPNMHDQSPSPVANESKKQIWQ